jgi:hypothetical protein
MGKAFGHLGAEHGIKGAQFGVLGAEHGIKGKDFGVLGAPFGHLGADAGRAAEQPNRNHGDMTPGEVQVLVSMIGGNDAACELLSVSKRTLMRYRSGDRVIPQALADRLRDRAFGRVTDPPASPDPNEENISSLGTPRSGGSVTPSDDRESDAAE